jgi:hypothetical protein
MKQKKGVSTQTYTVSCTSWLGRQIAAGVLYEAPTADGEYVLDGADYLMFTELAYGPLRRGDVLYA